ncbi:N-acetylmuramoyl-L-alanine amidase [Candidatus Erwinia haradaeae]|nr:N-acetylmuramoyl-L-alanine amidase [Candidatus Erwinia haradaeae]
MPVFFFFSVQASTLLEIDTANSPNSENITLSFSKKPVYVFFFLHHPDRIVIDVHNSTILDGLPRDCSSDGIVKFIRVRMSNTRNMRLVFQLADCGKIRAVTNHSGSRYNLIFTMIRHHRIGTHRPADSCKFKKGPLASSAGSVSKHQHLTSQIRRYTRRNAAFNAHGVRNKIIVAIDAGHGGQDPGAISRHGLKEKNITIDIARQLQAWLNSDPMFYGVMIRNSDHFISVSERSKIAHNKKANILISIHADSARNRRACGASAWVLSNRRANRELVNRLAKKDGQFTIFQKNNHGMLKSNYTDRYVRKALLDLQFIYSQRVGYEVATKVLCQLKHVSPLHKTKPAYASFGVLRSPYIPSLLIEIGFISNTTEEKLLASRLYQKRLSKSLYQGLHNYFLFHPSQYVSAKKT